MSPRAAAAVLTLGVLVSASSSRVAAQAPGTQATSPRVYRPGIGVGFPALLRQVQPIYSDAARKAGIQGTVTLEAVVQPDGTVDRVRVVRSLDAVHGLDDNAIAAAKKWLYRPASRDGRPVPVIVTIELAYKVADNRLPTPLALPPTPAGDDEFLKGAYSSETAGLVLPKLLASRNPHYTSAAMRAKIKGVAEVEAVVGIDGSVLRSRIKRSVDNQFGLDQEALVAANQCTFEPGRLNGQQVAVVIIIAMEFRLH